MAEYTELMETRFWELDDDIYGDYLHLLDQLNSPDFRTFGAGLEALIRTKMPADSTLTPAEYLKQCCKKKDITVASSRNTLTNWFSKELRPKKGPESRQRMFAIAFALGLSIDETKYLFHNVYLDRAFNKRDYREFIYYYCLQNQHTLQHAQELISKVPPINSDAPDATIDTYVIAHETEALSSDDAVLSYISLHQHNFSLNNKRAHEVLQQYIEKTKALIKDDVATWDVDRRKGVWNETTTNYMYTTIIGQPVTDISAKGTVTIFKNAVLPNEIKSCFPQPSTFADKSPSYEEIRKMIILLFSFYNWFSAEKDDEVEFDLGMYEDQLNHLLEVECGFPPLYYGNPFDWLFLYCARTETPLETFQGLVAIALGDEG